MSLLNKLGVGAKQKAKHSITQNYFYTVKENGWIKFQNDSRGTCNVEYVFKSKQEMIDFITLAEDLLDRVYLISTGKVFANYKQMNEVHEKLDKIYCQF